MNPPALTYLSAQDAEWATQLRAARTLPELRALALAWGRWTPDARRVAGEMAEADFLEFRQGLEKESRKEFTGESFARRYGALLIPERLMEITIRAAQFGVPFGTMAILIAETHPHHPKWRWLPALVGSVSSGGKPKGDANERH